MNAIPLVLAFLTLARTRNPEAVWHQAPGEWDAIPGPDRCPEVKMLRGRIRAPGGGCAAGTGLAILPGRGVA